MPPALTLAPPAPTSIEPLQTRIYLPSELTLNFAGKFLEQYVSLKDVPGPCWVWTAGATQKGYGMVGDLLLKRVTQSHRLAYEHLVGPIPDGMQIDHLCEVKPCCNPLHLEVVTRSENLRRRGGATSTHCKRGHPRTAENTRIKKRNPDGTPRRTACLICDRESVRLSAQRRREAKRTARHDLSTGDFAEAA